LELDPEDATAHQWYAEHLAYIGGKEEEALAEANRAHQLFMDYDRGYIDLEEKTLQPLQNPFGPKV